MVQVTKAKLKRFFLKTFYLFVTVFLLLTIVGEIHPPSAIIIALIIAYISVLIIETKGVF